MAIARPFTTGSRGSATGCSAFCSITEWLQRTGGLMLGSTRHFAWATPTTCCSSPSGSNGQSLKKSLRCGGGPDLRAINKIDEAVVPALGRLSAETLGPAVERIRRIAGWFGLAAASQAGVDKIAGDRLERRVIVVVDHRDCDAVAAQHLRKGRRCKAAMAYFDNVPYRAAAQLLRQQSHKGGEAGLVQG